MGKLTPYPPRFYPDDPKVAKYLNAEVLARFRRNVGGVRIEDDILITETGIENLTAAIPKEIKDIETIMNSSN